MVSCLPIWYFQKSFNGTFPFLPPSKYKLGPCRTEACLLLEVGTLASGLEGTTEVHMVHLQKRQQIINWVSQATSQASLLGQVWRGTTNANCFFSSQAEVMLFLAPTFVWISVGHDPKIWASFLHTASQHYHHTSFSPLKGRHFLFSFLFCW